MSNQPQLPAGPEMITITLPVEMVNGILRAAVDGSNIPLLTALIAGGASMNTREPDMPESGLFRYAQFGDSVKMTRAWCADELILDEEEINKITDGHQETVDMLMETDIDVTETSPTLQTPLHEAAKHDYRRTKQLLAKGAHVDAADVWQMTPLHRAVMHDRPDIVRLLIAAGADANAADDDGITPAGYAEENDMHHMREAFVYRPAVGATD